MRILHTSDWHIGRSFHRQGMLDAQAAYVDHLLETVRSEKVDLVVVSGDVYDRALPPVDAVDLADDAFARLAGSRAAVVVTSGNHDSAIRLGFNSRLTDASGVFLRTRPRDIGTPVVLEDSHGPVAVYGLPYLEPDAVREAWGLGARTHEAALTEAMRRVGLDLAGQPSGTRSVAMAHAFVAGNSEAAGAMSSDSERNISVGGVQIAPTSLFSGVDYAALGHLHGRHTLTDSIRYSGSPLAYSFSEATHLKGAWLVDLGRDGFEAAEFVEAPVPRRLARISGRMEELLSDRRYDALEDRWIQATITDSRRPLNAMERLRVRFPQTLILGFEPEGAGATRKPPSARIDGRSDFDIALGFVAEVREQEATTEEALLLQLACDSCRIAEDGKDDQLTRPPVEDEAG